MRLVESNKDSKRENIKNELNKIKTIFSNSHAELENAINGKFPNGDFSEKLLNFFLLNYNCIDGKSPYIIVKTLNDK